MIWELALFAAGVAALAAGADWLVSGSSRLAGSLGVPPLVTGLTVVAFGTSAPELVVSVGASWQGRAGLAVGNVMGSTVANVGLIVGLCALVGPMAVHRRLLARETPLVAVVLIGVLALSWDGYVGRLDGAILLATFAVYTAFLIRWALAGDLGAEGPADPEDVTPAAVLESGGGGPAAGDGGDEPPRRGRPASGEVNHMAEAGRCLIGLGALILGAYWIVGSGAALARGLGVPEAVVGATVVAVGTSLPELASSLAAAARGLGDVAVGNVLGSNVFNLALVLGTAAAVRPVEITARTVTTQILPALALSLLLIAVAYTGRRVGRVEGALLLAVYAGFLVWIL